MATITATYTNEAGFRDYLRRAVGHPNSTVLLPDDTCDDVVNDAFETAMRDFRLVDIALFPTVVDQQFYGSLLPAGGIAIKRVFWPIPAACLSLSLQLDDRIGILLTEVVSEDGARIAVDPGLANLALLRNARLQRLAGGGAHIENARAVYLDPIPSTVRNVYFVYTYRPFDAYMDIDLAADVGRAFLDLVRAELNERLALGAGAISDVEDKEEGTRIRIDTQAHERAAIKLQQKYLRQKPPIRTVWP